MIIIITTATTTTAIITTIAMAIKIRVIIKFIVINLIRHPVIKLIIPC
jgi:hypothetical protein